MKLIWTYNYDAIVGGNVGSHTPERRIILLNYYILSIQNAKRFGYYCIVYCFIYELCLAPIRQGFFYTKNPRTIL